jgi:hypothetical protein
MSLELNRRDLLRFFGIGATIVPVIGGAAKLDSPARLIEVPKVEPAATLETDDLLEHLFIQRKIFRVTVEGEFGQQPRRCKFYARSFLVDMCQETIDITDPGDQHRRFMPGVQSADWTLKGCCLGERVGSHNELFSLR